MDAWLERTGHKRGATIDLAQMWALVQPWYADRLAPEWRGRSAREAQAIMDDVGLTGEFWRLV
ncbi:MAG TPA: hypothetical protein EYQ27_16880 [Gemmatimonadetes bacterium]|nr:hypothetical protein [Gemmatimonadota bacterium]